MICLKIPTFVVATTTTLTKSSGYVCCDLLENSYLCGSNNNAGVQGRGHYRVVICLKIPTFVVATTTLLKEGEILDRCDLLENSYLCGSNNN